MAVNTTWAGVTYPLPQNREPKGSWGASTSAFLIAVAAQAIPKTGGLNPLTAELNLGSTFGVLVPYIKSASANIAAAGVIRLAKTDVLAWRNNANSGDLTLGIDGSDNLTFNGVNLSTAPANLAAHIAATSVHGVSGAVVGTTDAQAISNKDIDGGTASNSSRITVPKAARSTLTGLTRKQGTLVYDTTSSKLLVDNGSTLDSVGSGSGELNLVGNPSDAANWTKTGSTGAGANNPATTTTAGDLPLGGIIATAIQITSGTSAGAEASHYTSYSFTTPASYAVKTKVELWMRPGANFINSEWTISVYAGSTRQALTTDSSAVTYLPNALGKFTTYFDAVAGTAYTVRVARTVNAGGNAGVLNLANVIVGPGIQPQGAVVGPWLTYTPTGSWSTNTTYSGRYRQVGDSFQFRVQVATSGAPTAADFSLNFLPAGYTLNTAAIPGTAGSATTLTVGEASLSNNGGAFYPGAVTLSSATTVRVVHAVPASNIGIVGYTNPFTFAANGYIQMDFTVPMNELAGSGTVNLAQNDIQYYSGVGTWGTNSTPTTVQGLGGSIGGTTTPGGVVFSYTLTPPNQIQAGAAVQLQVSNDQLHWSDAAGAAWSAGGIFETLRYDGTTYYGGSAYLDNTGKIQVYFGKYPTGNGATVWAGTWYWRVAVGLPGQVQGFGAYLPPSASVPAGASGLVPASGLPGRTDGSNPQSGSVGELVDNSASAAAVTTATDVVSITLTAGLWLCGTSANGNAGSGSNVMTVSWKVKGTIGSTQGKDYVLNAQVVNDRGVVTLTNRVVTIAPADADKTVKLNVANTVSQNVAGYIWAVRIA